MIAPWKENYNKPQIRSDQSLSSVRLFATRWIPARQVSLSITNSQSSLRLMSVESVMPSSHLILCCPLLLLPPIPPSIVSESFPMSQLFAWGGQNTGVSALAPFLPKKSQGWQHIKKQRHHFADNGLYSQSCGFAISHVWMWELDHKEDWVLKNWWF